ncbi:1-hydroxycarotenoid 3,4-desaturase CrtD [Yoonia sp. R2331]|uniref:1-hydroxycarotenoid 3,4-desaturase CrtD n=1 Tax=Yoonia sp. R2331 TaxID=3237238 RepID=UPI0034E516D9
MPKTTTRVIIIGAGIGGLAAALRLAHSGCAVTVLEMHGGPGGKMRTLPSAAGPVDAGPTVLTMRPVFEALFADCGLSLSDHLTLRPLDVIARHFWDDGTTFDLMADRAATVANVHATFGSKAAAQYTRFADRAARLFAAFDAPMMQAEAPRQTALIAHVLRNPRLVADMAPWRNMARDLSASFRDPRLAQLFGRYATYVGGSPLASPAILSLISDAEAQGVWAVDGGMHRLAQVLQQQAEALGATFQFNTAVTRIIKQGGAVTGVEAGHDRFNADVVLFNGDPRALQVGALGKGVAEAVPGSATTPRSLSAYVHAFAAAPRGPDLAHHNVFFGKIANAEFQPLSRGKMPQDATLYLCAQDHGSAAIDAMQRFEVIMNAPPVVRDPQEEKHICQTLTFSRLAAFGLRFTPTPGPDTLTTPQEFDALCPHSMGSLYGRSPQGMTAAFKRPKARTSVKGLYLCGGGAHPGAGVPMATLSARHAAAAIMTDQTLTSTSPATAMPGGMSMGSATAGPKRSLS